LRDDEPKKTGARSLLTYLFFDPFAHELDDGPHNEERIARLQKGNHILVGT
jgi:hypothetical protein